MRNVVDFLSFFFFFFGLTFLILFVVEFMMCYSCPVQCVGQCESVCCSGGSVFEAMDAGSQRVHPLPKPCSQLGG